MLGCLGFVPFFASPKKERKKEPQFRGVFVSMNSPKYNTKSVSLNLTGLILSSYFSDVFFVMNEEAP